MIELSAGDVLDGNLGIDAVLVEENVVARIHIEDTLANVRAGVERITRGLDDLEDDDDPKDAGSDGIRVLS